MIIDAGTGTASVAAIGTGTEIGALTIGSAQNGGITLNGAIVTDGAVVIDGPVTLATGAVSVTTADDNVTFNHTIDGAQTLTVNSGGGNVVFTEAIGGTTSISGLSVNPSAGSGDITFTSTIGDANTIGVVGTTAVGNSATDDLNFDGAIYKFDGATTFTAESGQTIDMSAAVSFTTAADNIEFATANIELANTANLTIDTGAAEETSQLEER